MKSVISLLLALSAGLPLAASQAGDRRTAPVDIDRPSSTAAEARSAHCLQDTGSRIKRRSGQCLPYAGRSIRADDLRATGATSTAEALQNVDPSVRVFPGR